MSDTFIQVHQLHNVKKGFEGMVLTVTILYVSSTSQLSFIMVIIQSLIFCNFLDKSVDALTDTEARDLAAEPLFYDKLASSLGTFTRPYSKTLNVRKAWLSGRSSVMASHWTLNENYG